MKAFYNIFNDSNRSILIIASGVYAYIYQVRTGNQMSRSLEAQIAKLKEQEMLLRNTVDTLKNRLELCNKSSLCERRVLAEFFSAFKKN